MKILNISLVGLLAFAAMPASALFNPFAWFQAKSSIATPKECASDLKEIAEKLKPFKEKASQDTKLQRLQNLYTLEDELENFAKIRCGLKEKEKQIKEGLSTFRKKWGLNGNPGYSFNLIWVYRHRNIVSNPKLRAVEKEAGVSPRPVRLSWYVQLEQKMKALPESELKKTVEDRKKEFKAWQQSNNRAR